MKVVPKGTFKINTEIVKHALKRYAWFVWACTRTLTSREHTLRCYTDQLWNAFRNNNYDDAGCYVVHHKHFEKIKKDRKCLYDGTEMQAWHTYSVHCPTLRVWAKQVLWLGQPTTPTTSKTTLTWKFFLVFWKNVFKMEGKSIFWPNFWQNVFQTNFTP